jgi:hypothetical protein
MNARRAAYLAAALACAAACSKSPDPALQAEDHQSSERSGQAQPVHVLTLAYDRPAVVGATVRASAGGLPPGRDVELVWKTVRGGWVVEDAYHFKGKKYSDAATTLGRFSVASDGALDATFTIPEDYGGVHDVVASIDGVAFAQAGIDVSQSFEMTPSSGPVGTPIELKVRGLGWRTMESTWVVNWDNHALGWVSAASTLGTATARFRATGPVGDHIVKLYTGWQGQAYLNHEQSPVAHLPRPQFTFHTTPGPLARRAYAEPYQSQVLPPLEPGPGGGTISLIPSQGPVGTRAVFHAEGLAPGASLALAWETHVGSRVTDDGFAPERRELLRVTVDPDGRIDVPLVIPEDLGGVHAVTVRAGAEVLARTYFAIETSVVSIAPTEGPPGTPVSIHLKGVGWTEFDNIYIATYDNGYMGYACGFNSQGDVVVNFTAAGEPGEHLIDFYPGIYQGPAGEPQQLYRLPQLTYADDHPGNRIPALRFAFRVTAPR